MTDPNKMIVLVYRPIIKIEVPFDDDHYPGMSVREAILHEESKTYADQMEEIITHLSNATEPIDLNFAVGPTIGCFEREDSVPDPADVPDLKVVEPICMIPDCGCPGKAHG